VETIGRYRILHKLGEGGMGAVYAAHDDRLDRPVAIKKMHGRFGDGQDRLRLWREARTGASVNHPNVCQIYEIGEDGDELFLAMELLEGEPLSARLARGALPVGEAGAVALAVLGALGALHQKGIVHRDLKPSNVFLSRHGVKLLDFGVARPVISVSETYAGPVTLPGMLVGTPRYMAPEQIEGNAVDARSDLFVLGLLLYEMLSGQSPFPGESVFEVARAIAHDEPRALGGSSAVVAVDRVIHRALRKRPEERYQSAEACAQDLRAALLATDSTETPRARPLTRLVVLPFRLLRPDPQIDFLSFSLADEISSALSGLSSLVVRSTIAASPFVGEAPDIRALAATLDVDVVLLGTLLHNAAHVRVNAQLVQAPSGTLVRAITLQVPADDVFQLQDRLATSIVESLSLTLSAHDRRRMSRDTPASADAYEYYLRANQIASDSKRWVEARDLYLRCVEIDPQFAPAWARLGRCYRVLGKYGDPLHAEANTALAEDAIRRALSINPDLSLAHYLYTHIEVEAGRAREAMVRLLHRARQDPSQPELFAGLVHACRYCGLLDASEAAYHRAMRLDPAVVTSAAQTYLIKGDYERAMALDRGDPPFVKALALLQCGRQPEGLELLNDMLERGSHATKREMIAAIVAVFERRYDDTIASVHRLVEGGFRDPEGLYHWAAALALAGDLDGALALLERSLEGGFFAVSALLRDPWLDSLRALPDFRHLVHRAEERQRESLDAFRAAEGPRVLGVPHL
jgi:eukaryotic-like serine/threonine-protein kinase